MIAQARTAFRLRGLPPGLKVLMLIRCLRPFCNNHVLGLYTRQCSMFHAYQFHHSMAHGA